MASEPLYFMAPNALDVDVIGDHNVVIGDHNVVIGDHNVVIGSRSEAF